MKVRYCFLLDPLTADINSSAVTVWQDNPGKADSRMGSVLSGLQVLEKGTACGQGRIVLQLKVGLCIDHQLLGFPKTSIRSIIARPRYPSVVVGIRTKSDARRDHTRCVRDEFFSRHPVLDALK